MNHQEIERQEIFERYVQHRLTPSERLAFQEHYFACDECFEQVELNARFVAGVQNASRAGALDKARETAASSSWFDWFTPALALSVAACLLLIGAIVWLALWKVPGYRQQIARERQSREESERKLLEERNQADESQRQLEIERAERAKLTPQTKPGERAGPDVIAQAITPTVTLEATRDAGSGSVLAIPPAAKNVIVRIPVEPGNRVNAYRVQIQTRSGQPVETFDKIKPNRSGTLNVAVSVNSLSAGQYLVRLYGTVGTQTELLGEYDLRVIKQ